MTTKERRLHVLKNQVRRLEHHTAVLRRQNDQLSNLRLFVFVAGAVITAVFAWQFGLWWGGGLLVGWAAGFGTAVYSHRRLQHSLHRHTLWLHIKQNHIARMTLDWAKLPSAAQSPSEHPFALDLDVVGQRSLHQLVDTAVSAEGNHRLQTWLLETHPDPTIIQRRQAQVRELADMPLFRDKLTLSARLTKTAEKPGQTLLHWLQTPPSPPISNAIFAVLGLLSLVNILLWVLHAGGVLPPWWQLTWAIYALLFLSQWRTIAPLLHDTLFLESNLEQLKTVFHFLETSRYGTNYLIQTLCSPFLGADRPSRHLQTLHRILAGVGLRQNTLFWLSLNIVIPWDAYFARRLAQCRHQLAELVPHWLEVWFELESLGSLATFAYLNPDYTFPQFAQESAVFAATQLGHPLLPDAQKVCNDFVVNENGRFFIITGSNMSGKSSFLRTIGINLCLAYAGGPINAQTMHTSFFRLFTSMRLTDSLTDGFSFFYAEVQRLHNLLVELEKRQERPLFFFIDEIFRGTNNRERLIGSRAYVQALVGGNGIGFIATHDLELAHLADELPTLMNYHFRDTIENGRMTFDYKLHSGPCPTTNALKIMQLAGLPIPHDQQPFS